MRNNWNWISRAQVLNKSLIVSTGEADRRKHTYWFHPLYKALQTSKSMEDCLFMSISGGTSFANSSMLCTELMQKCKASPCGQSPSLCKVCRKRQRDKILQSVTCQQIADASQINHELKPAAYMWRWEHASQKQTSHCICGGHEPTL